MQTKVLLLTEHDNKSLKDVTLNTLSAARQLSQDITLLVLGYNCNEVAKKAAELKFVTEVLWGDSQDFEWALAELMAACISDIVKSSQYTHILAPATTFGKNILPRAAALLGVGQISDITKILSEDIFVRPIYAGSVYITVQSLDPIKFITVRPSQFKATAAEGTDEAPIKSISYQTSENISNSTYSKFIKNEASHSERPELTSAKIVISGGRGLQSKENFKLLEEVADKLGAAIGASRAAVDAGFVGNDYQVGQTGKNVAPDLYIAIGISGAIQHLSGMKDSKVIVAINKDPEAPIFQVADYGLVGDLFKILPELSQEITLRKLEKIG